MNTALWLLLFRGGDAASTIKWSWWAWVELEGEVVFKNTAGQKIDMLAIDTSTNTPKTGDSANITAYLSKDDGTLTALTDTSAAEVDATNAPGVYRFDVSQTETNADKLMFTGKSSTANIKIVPRWIQTQMTGTGHGAYSCTWTINDGSTALENATVRFSNGSTNVFTGLTNSSGEIAMSLDAATYTVSITKDGYSFTPTTHAVSATSSTWTATFSMTEEATAPDADPAKSVTTITCYGTDTLIEAGVTVSVRQLTPVPGDQDHIFDSETVDYTSDVSGQVTITMWRRAKYRIKAGDGPWQEFTPTAAVESLDSFMGRN